MLSKEELVSQKERFMKLLAGTERAGIPKLLDYLNVEGFFEAPASTKFHGCYKGGLTKHSLGVYDTLAQMVDVCEPQTNHGAGMKPLELTKDTLIIAALLHDVCKVGVYAGTEKPYKWIKGSPKGHASLSIKRIKEFIELTELEEMMIRFHMGVYGLDEFYKAGDWQTGEYHLRGDHIACQDMSKEESQKARYGKSLANAWYHNPIVKLMYFADELATMEEKTLEV